MNAKVFLWACMVLVAVAIGGYGCEQVRAVEPVAEDGGSGHWLIVGEDSLVLDPIYETLSWYELEDGDTVYQEEIRLVGFSPVALNTVKTPRLVTFIDGDQGRSLDTTAEVIRSLVVAKPLLTAQLSPLIDAFTHEFRLVSDGVDFKITEMLYFVYCESGECSHYEGRNAMIHKGATVPAMKSIESGEYLLIQYLRAESPQGQYVHIHPKMCWKIE